MNTVTEVKVNEPIHAIPVAKAGDLPSLKPAEGPAAKSAELPPVKAVEERRFLILDDNDANRLLLKFAVQAAQATFVEAATAQQAVDQFKPGQVSFAFLDIELPDFSGLEVATRLRAIDEHVAIIMCSTNDDPQTVTKAIDAGCDMFVVKPFQLDMLMDLVKVLDRAVLRSAPDVLIVENTARRRLQPRKGTAPLKQPTQTTLPQ
ncbi:MAG TPA: response regulator [Aggregatilineales bacterium]|nr:response regulator [Aggregatilineales bacterium]